MKRVIVGLAILVFIVFILMNAIFFFFIAISGKKEYCKCSGLSKTKFTNNTLLTEVDAADFRWSATIFNRFLNGKDWIFDHICTGAVINPSMVLTSGHCFDDKLRKRKNDEFVAAGQHDLLRIHELKMNLKKIKNVHFHPQYNLARLENGYRVLNDLAIVEIKGSFDFDNQTNIMPACLTYQSVEKNGNEYIVSGFELNKDMLMSMYRSMTGTGGRALSQKKDKLMALKVRQTSCDEFQLLDSRSEQGNGSLICCANKGDSQCIDDLRVGDQGLNLLLEAGDHIYLIGIINGVTSSELQKESECSLPNSHSVFTSVFAHLEWIKKQTDDNMCPNAIKFNHTQFSTYILISGLIYFAFSFILLSLLVSYLKAHSKSRESLVDLLVKQQAGQRSISKKTNEVLINESGKRRSSQSEESIIQKVKNYINSKESIRQLGDEKVAPAESESYDSIVKKSKESLKKSRESLKKSKEILKSSPG